jgi:hypothetical protein
MSDDDKLYRPDLTEREKRYLRLLTQQANNEQALAHFCRYVGWYDTDTNKPKQKPFAQQIARLKQLAAMPNLWNKIK